MNGSEREKEDGGHESKSSERVHDEAPTVPDRGHLEEGMTARLS
jgi:hypothetical protein